MRISFDFKEFFKGICIGIWILYFCLVITISINHYIPYVKAEEFLRVKILFAIPVKLNSLLANECTTTCKNKKNKR